MNLSLIITTIIQLRMEQILHRVVRKFYRPSPCRHPLQLRPSGSNVVFPAIKRSAMHSTSSITFLHQKMVLEGGNLWNDARYEALWLYNLHYFDDLNAPDYRDKQSIHKQFIDKWIADNPVGRGVGWDSYPLSLRIVNWIKWHAGCGGLSSSALNCLAVQTRYLSRRIEYHLLANHLFANAKALVFSGLFFQGTEADSWLKKGLQILARELPEQILDDGGNYERSPMYHGIMLEDVLDLLMMCRRYSHTLINERFVSLLKDKADKMLHWLVAMCHGDGKIALFNDAAFNIAPEYRQLVDYAAACGVKQSVAAVSLNDLSNSGYVSYHNDSYTIIIDAGEIGPTYQPGHAHADTLSFELSRAECRLVVDSGTSCYGTSPERLRQRKTAAHNTVTIDGYDSSEVWSGFRVARRAKIVERNVEEHDGVVTVTAAHHGFKRITGVGNHRRTWMLRPDGIGIADTIEGKGVHLVEAHLHFHPETTISLEGTECCICRSKNITMQLSIDERMDVRLVDATYHPEFGVVEKSRKLLMRIRTELPFQFATTMTIES